MISRTAILNASAKADPWKVADQRGIKSPTELSTGPEGPSRIELGLVKLGTSDGKGTECQLYQRGKCHYGEQCKYIHVHREKLIRAPEIATSIRYSNHTRCNSKSSTDSDNITGVTDPVRRERMNSADNGNPYPVRDGAADCQYYLKTGKCNYGSRCKFNHPFRDENLVNALNRRDCFDFVQKGTCPYGKGCKYNHPTSGDDLLRSSEYQSSPTTASSGSTPASESRRMPRRSASEPRYSTRRNLSEEFSSFQINLTPIDMSHTRGKTLQPASKRETSPNYPVTLAMRLDNNAQYIQSSMSMQKTHSPRHSLENLWTSKGNRSTIAAHLNAELSTAFERGSEVNPGAYFPLVRQEHLYSSASPHGNCQMVPQLVPSPELRQDGGLFQGNQGISNGKYDQGHAELSGSGRAVPPITPNTVSLDRKAVPELCEQEMRVLRTSIWRNNFSSERTENSMNVSSSRFDYGPSPQDRVASASAPETSNRLSFRDTDRDLIHTTRWLTDSACPPLDQHLPNPATSVSVPATSSGYTLGGESYPSQAIPRVTERAHPVPSSWRLSSNTNYLELSPQELHHLQNQEQVHVQPQCFSQYHIEQQAKLCRMERYSSPEGFRTESGKMQDLDEKRHDMIRTAPHLQQNYICDLMLPPKEMETGTNVAWNRTSFDPLGYKAMALEHEASDTDFEKMSNVWKPSEKSPMFGPGLFGMPHHA